MDVGDPSALGTTLRTLLDRGVPLQQALPAFTSNVAQLLRLQHKGRLAVGADADLVVLDDSASIRDVMVNGSWHVKDGTPIVRGQFENVER